LATKVEKPKVFAAVLPFHHEDETGVHFGVMESEYEDPEHRDKMPAYLVISHLIWENQGKPTELTAGFFAGTSEEYFFARNSLFVKEVKRN
jgi:hypothetical protein